MKKYFLQISIFILSFNCFSAIIFNGGISNIDSVSTINTIGIVATVNESRIYGTYDNVNYVPIVIDYSNGYLITLSHLEASILSGYHFSICSFNVLGDNESITFSVTTPAVTPDIHMTFSVYGTTQTEVRIYKEATGLSGGSTVNAINSNGNSTNVSRAIIKGNPSITGNGTLIYLSSRGFDSATPAHADLFDSIIDSIEKPLKRGVTYLYVITSRGANNIVSYCGNWDEHTNLR